MKNTRIFYVAMAMALAICLVSPMAGVAATSQSPYPLPNSFVSVTGTSMGAGSGFAVTDSNGNFTINSGLPTGNYNVTISNTGYIDKTIITNITNDNVTNLGTIYLNASGIITGTVENPSGSPVANVIVTLGDNSNNTVGSQITSANGTFTFNTNIVNGTYSIQTYVPQSIQYASPAIKTGINAIQGQTTQGVVITLLPTGAIAGTITDSKGNGVAGVTVIASGVNTFLGSTATTDAQGHYNISSNLATGSYNVTIVGTIPGSIVNESAVTVVSVTAGSTTTLNFTLPQSGSISGNVTYANGNPASGISVTAFLNSSEQFGFGAATTAANGSYLINDNLPSGSYGVYANGNFTGAVTVNVTAGNVTPNVNFQIGTNPAWIGGKVSNSTGPLASATVAGTYNATTSFEGFSFNVPVTNSTYTAADGTYLLQINVPSNVTSISVNVTATADNYNDSSQLVNVTVGQTTSNVNFVLSATPTPSGTLTGIVVSTTAPPLGTATLSLSPSSNSVAVGSTLTLSGALSPAGTGKVTIYQSINGSAATTLAAQSLSASSTYSYSFNPSAVGNYTFWASWPGNSTYVPVNSTTVAVSVTSIVTENITLNASASSVLIGTPVTLSGTSTISSTTLTLDVSLNGTAFQPLANVSVVNGLYSYIFNATAPGEFALKAYNPATSQYSPTVSVFVSTIPITLTTSAANATVGSPVTLSGITVLNTTTLTLEVSLNGTASQPLANVSVVNGSYSYIFNATAPGEFVFQAYNPATAQYSPPVSVFVSTAPATTTNYTVYYVIIAIIVIIIIIAAIYAATRRKPKPKA